MDELTDLPVKVVNTHAHWDYIGGNNLYDNIYVHQQYAKWLKEGFPISLTTVKNNEYIDLGGRLLKVILTPGHSSGHICLYEKEKGYLYIGDLVYKGVLYVFYPSTNPTQFLNSVLKLNQLQEVNRIFPGHKELNLLVQLLEEVKKRLKKLKRKQLLAHISGVHEFESFQELYKEYFL